MRMIGIRHRIKRTAEQEARPTQVVILEESGPPVSYLLTSDDDEFDWTFGRFPVAWRPATTTDELSTLAPHHQRWRKLRKSEVPPVDAVTRPASNERFELLELPTGYDGFQPGDTLVVVLSGIANRMVYACARRAESFTVPSGVLRVSGHALKDTRETLGRTKDDDALTLAELGRDRSPNCYPVTPRDRMLIHVIIAYEERIRAMKLRIAADQQFTAHSIGQRYLDDAGGYPEGSIEAAAEAARLADPGLTEIRRQEERLEQELVSLVTQLDVYRALFAPIEGIGPLIAARLIVSIGDVRAYPTAAKLKKVLGVHVCQGGAYGNRPSERQFPRRRKGERASWNPDGRQAVYLFLDQCNRRPDSRWGAYFRAMKVAFRARHPEPIDVNGTRRYTNGHIHRMAWWRTGSRFIEWLWRAWTRLEREAITE